MAKSSFKQKISFTFVVFILAMSAVLVSVFFWWSVNTSPLVENGEVTRFIVPKGASGIEVGNLLYEKKLIRSPLAFKIWVQLFDRQRSIMPGEFNLSPDMTLGEIVDLLGKGPSEVWVTIPEGLRKEEIAVRIIKSIGISGNEAQVFKDEFLRLAKDQEGYLFPDTYLFAPDITAQKALSVLRDTFDKKITADMLDDVLEKGLTLNEVVILASIVEKETKTNIERPIVAGIFFNRLDIGMALQADATAQYPLGTIRCANVPGECTWWKPPTRDDLQINSPYNTYKYSGIPVGPIANPGLSSIEAVIYSKDSPYFYYIHDPKGNIHYAQTLEEHNMNVQKYLR